MFASTHSSSTSTSTPAVKDKYKYLKFVLEYYSSTSTKYYNSAHLRLYSHSIEANQSTAIFVIRCHYINVCIICQGFLNTVAVVIQPETVQRNVLLPWRMENIVSISALCWILCYEKFDSLKDQKKICINMNDWMMSM